MYMESKANEAKAIITKLRDEMQAAHAGWQRDEARAKAEQALERLLLGKTFAVTALDDQVNLEVRRRTQLPANIIGTVTECRLEGDRAVRGIILLRTDVAPWKLDIEQLSALNLQP